MITIEKIIAYLPEKAKQFGAKNKDENLKDYVLRKNINLEAFKKGGACFGFIHPEEESSGPYHNFLYVVFPSNSDNSEVNFWVLCLGIGSLGFKNDFEFATFPGIRRLFQCMIKKTIILNSKSHDKIGSVTLIVSEGKNLLSGEKG